MKFSILIIFSLLIINSLAIKNFMLSNRAKGGATDDLCSKNCKVGSIKDPKDTPNNACDEKEVPEPDYDCSAKQDNKSCAKNAKKSGCAWSKGKSKCVSFCWSCCTAPESGTCALKKVYINDSNEKFCKWIFS